MANSLNDSDATQSERPLKTRSTINESFRPGRVINAFRSSDPKTFSMKTETREFKISYDNFESAVIAWLYSVGAIPKNLDVIGSDFGVEVDDQGQVHFDLELIPFGRSVQGELNV